MKLKDVSSLKVKLWQPREFIKNQIHYFANKGPSSQSYDFPSSQLWMWELDHKVSWAPKSWCFWTVVLEKNLESPLDCKENKPTNPKENQSCILISVLTIWWCPCVESCVVGRRCLVWPVRFLSFNTEIRLIIFDAAKDGEALYSQQKLFITKFRLKLQKVGKTTRPLKYDQIKSFMIVQWKWETDLRA